MTRLTEDLLGLMVDVWTNYLESCIDILPHLLGNTFPLVRTRYRSAHRILQHPLNNLLSFLENFRLRDFPLGLFRPEEINKLLSCGNWILHLGLRSNSQCRGLLTLTSLRDGDGGGVGGGGVGCEGGAGSG